MKGFYIEITNRLLEPKHYQKMKESVWLFMWLLDAMTSINEQGIGKVLGGKPIKFEEIKKDLGISERTYNRWVLSLKRNGYINTIRTPYGLTFSVNKAKKRFGKRDTPKMAYPVPPKIVRDTPRLGVSSATNAGSNIRQYKDNTKDRVDFSKNGNILKGKQELYKKMGWREKAEV